MSSCLHEAGRNASNFLFNNNPSFFIGVVIVFVITSSAHKFYIIMGIIVTSLLWAILLAAKNVIPLTFSW